MMQKNVQAYSNLVGEGVLSYNEAESDKAVQTTTHFEARPPTYYSPYALWLMLDKDPLGYGEITSITCNHRSPPQSEFAKPRAQFGKKVPDELIREISDRRDRQFLQNGEMEAMPYQLEQASAQTKFDYLSVGRFNFKSTPDNPDGEPTAKEVVKTSLRLKIGQRSACNPEKQTLKGLVGFLGLHHQTASKAKKQGKKLVHADGKGNYGEILELFTRVENLGSSVAALNSMCQSLHLPWTYKLETHPGEANRHFAYFFNMATKLRFAILEGQHRYAFRKRVHPLR
jgi:hypothetical protein